MATMCLERRRVKRKFAPDAYYYYLTTRQGSLKKRTYIPLCKVADVMDMLKARRLNGKRKTGPAGKDVDQPDDRRFYPESLRHIIASAGYNVQGSRIMICWKRFLTKAAASVRFSLLEPEYQDAVGSPDNLLRLNTEAYSIMQRRNRNKIRTSYQDCMAELCPIGMNDIVQGGEQRPKVAA
jgi:hypothetical protein